MNTTPEPAEPKNPNTGFFTMDVGGSHANAALVAVDGLTATTLLRQDGMLDANGDTEDILEAITGPARTLLAKASRASSRGENVAGMTWTIALPGPFDYEGGFGTFEGVAKFDSIAGIDLRAAFAERVGVAAETVHFVNDADAYGMGEWGFGGDSRPDRLLCLTLGTGVGSSFLDQGRPVSSGPLVPRDGEAHTLTFRDQPLEQTVSSPAISAAFLAASGIRCDVRTICQYARDGNAAAISILDERMSALGETLAPWIASFDVSTVVIGGSIARSWDVLEHPLRAGISNWDTVIGETVQLRNSTLLDAAPLLGAAEWASRS